LVEVLLRFLDNPLEPKLPEYLTRDISIYNTWLRLLFILGILGLQPLTLQSQCAVQELFGEPILIRDTDTTRVRIKVDNARVNELGDNFQALCGVRLNFDHTNVSDLDMTLVSPAGDQVILIGPATGVGTIPSLFPVSHDIEFRQVLELVTPDPGFDRIWSNNNLSWAPIAGGYTGQYHPFSGDIDVSFAGGSVNGVWELIVIDGFLNQEGVLNSVEQSQLDICREELIDFAIPYQSDNYDSTQYRDDFIIYAEDSFVMLTDEPDLTLLEDGIHYIYGINSLSSDFDSIVKYSALSLREVWIDSILSPGGLYCWDVSDPLILNISTPVESILPTQILCNGDSVFFDGRFIRETGIYREKIGGCDTVIVLELQSSDLILAAIPERVYLDCKADTLKLDGTSISTLPITYRWTDVDGMVISDSAVANITAVGIYELMVDDGICPDMLTVIVANPADTMTLSLSASTNDLNCQDTMALIYVDANFSYDSVRWTRTGEYVITADTLQLDQGGTYEATVFGSNGCQISESVIISQDDRKSNVSVVMDTITCFDPNVEIRVSVVGPPAINILWRDSIGDLVSNTSKVDITDVGNYSVHVVNDNLCDTTLFFSITTDTSTLEIENLPDSIIITCDAPLIDVESQAEGLVNSYWLSNTGDTLSNTTELSITVPGLYTAGVRGQSGCPSEKVVVANIDTISPLVQILGEPIDCNNLSRAITASSTTAGINYMWSGMLDSSRQNQAYVSEVGIITVSAIDATNGCSSQQSFSVGEDFAEPDIILTGPERLTCDIPIIEIENFSLESINGVWIMPMGDTVTAESITVDTPGDYTFVGTGANGCVKSGVKSVVDDRDGPLIDLPMSIDFNCSVLQSTN